MEQTFLVYATAQPSWPNPGGTLEANDQREINWDRQKRGYRAGFKIMVKKG
ncbi:hypothetical protein V1294_005863 [Bradyrhizobium sp. AZCC 1678]|uniref:hypothetical protein n=1 Tax=Bradyrhizobium sp. AZCC 1678 TaxID=3117030 RepID=UPI002FEF0951